MGFVVFLFLIVRWGEGGCALHENGNPKWDFPSSDECLLFLTG